MGPLKKVYPYSLLIKKRYSESSSLTPSPRRATVDESPLPTRQVALEGLTASRVISVKGPGKLERICIPDSRVFQYERNRNLEPLVSGTAWLGCAPKLRSLDKAWKHLRPNLCWRSGALYTSKKNLEPYALISNIMGGLSGYEVLMKYRMVEAKVSGTC